MKKKMIYSSALAALLSASSIALAGGPEIVPVEDYFSGFYIGGTGSLHHATLDGSSSVDFIGDDPAVNPLAAVLVPGTLFSAELNGGSVDGYGGVQGGFGWTFNHVWYLGVQGFGEWGQQSDTSTSDSKLVDFNILGIDTDVATATSTTQVKISNDYGVAAKFGYVVAPRTLVYGKVGASWADIQVNNTATVVNDFNILPPVVENVHSVATASSSSSDNKIGLLLGIGFEQFVWEDLVSVNVEYDYVNYGTVSTGPTPLILNSTTTVLGVVVPPDADDLPADFQTALTTQANGSATVNAILAGINFYFGRNWF